MHVGRHLNMNIIRETGIIRLLKLSLIIWSSHCKTVRDMQK